MTKHRADRPDKQETADEQIVRMFAALSREEKQQFLTFFENAPERRSSPASDRRQHGKEAP
mgnify:CR=1 FL=1